MKKLKSTANTYSERIEAQEAAIYGMANIRPKATGLPMVIWVSEKTGVRHGARVKVSLKHGDKIDPTYTVSVTISETPIQIGKNKLPAKDFALVKKFILLNMELLLGYWNRTVSMDEFLERIKSV